MKKRLVSLTASLLLLLLLSLAPAAFAAPGTAVGCYYGTDIVTFLWGVTVNTVNIGGETLIDAESLSHYGFTVTWLPDKRELVITDGLSRSHDDAAGSDSLLDMACGTPGAVLGRYYATDIVTTLNGVPIDGYNIGGRTFIPAEMLREYGYTVEWRAETRQLLIDAPDMAEAPWGLTVNKEISNYGATGESEYFYLMSEKHFEDGVFYGGGMGKGFPDLTGIYLSRDRSGRIALTFCLDQSGILFSEGLKSKLSASASAVNGNAVCAPEPVRGALNSFLRVYLNGKLVTLLSLSAWQRSSHTDYTLALDVDIGLEPDAIYSAALVCNVPSDVQINLPPDTMGMTPFQVTMLKLKARWSYTILWEQETPSSMVASGLQTGTPHGSYNTLEIIRKSDGTLMNLFDRTGLADIWGHHPQAENLSVSADGTTLFFSCDKDGATYAFKSDLPAGTVQKIAS